MISRKIFIFAIFIFITLNISTSFSKEGEMENPKPPMAKKVLKADTLHQDVRIDNYFWLREKENPEAIAYLEAENKYTEALMKDTENLQDRLFIEMKSRIKETDLSVPVKIDDYYYYSRTEEGEQYSIMCRKKGSLEAEEEILLDQNELAEDLAYFDLGLYNVSPNHKLLAYAVDSTGAEKYTIYFKNLETDELLADKIIGVEADLAWANDNKTVFYTILDETDRPYKIFRHILGTEVKEDKAIFQDDDGRFFVWIGKTRSRDYLVIGSANKNTSEMWYLDASTPEGEFTLFQPRKEGVEYYISNHGEYFYVITNENAQNFKIMQTSIEATSKENWEEVIAHRDSVLLEGFDLFRNHLVISEREKGLKKIRIINFATKEDYYVNFPEPVYSFWISSSSNPDFNTNQLRFYYTSFITPGTIYDYDMDTKERELKKQDEVLGGYDPFSYVSERIFATAPDGTEVPISLVYRKNLEKDGHNPTYLTGYGAYGSSEDVYFSSIRLSLLNRGFVYAKAHIRGGQEMGRYWYEQGKLLNKKNTFTDFIACAEYLISEKYTSTEQLVIQGGSAGGLLVGAVTNMRPDLFKIVIASVPFVDALNTMLDPTIPLTVTEYDEWGNPNEKKYYDYIKSYAPYENVEAKAYPNLLVTAGLNDPRVPYWEAAKYVAKLRAMKTDDKLLLLKTNMGQGHLGASGRYDFLKEIAFEYAFIFKILGIED